MMKLDLSRLTPAAAAVIVALIALTAWAIYLDRSVIHVVVTAAAGLLGTVGTIAVHSARAPRDGDAPPVDEGPAGG